MRTSGRKFVPAAGALAFAMIMVPNIQAQCGRQPAKLAHPAGYRLQEGGARLLRTGSEEDAAPIVGMWHVTFTAEGNNPGPPDGTPIDNAIVVWHSDKTEIMNSARPPQDGDFCLGVWEQTGRNSYKLNHFAWLANDTTNAPSGIGNPSGPTHFVEELTLGPDRNHFIGRFSLDAYDTSGNVTTHIVGVIKGTRITMSTTVGDLL